MSNARTRKVFEARPRSSKEREERRQIVRELLTQGYKPDEIDVVAWAVWTERHEARAMLRRLLLPWHAILRAYL